MRQRGVNGIQTDAAIRGSSFDQVLVLVNGVGCAIVRPDIIISIYPLTLK